MIEIIGGQGTSCSFAADDFLCYYQELSMHKIKAF